MMFWMRWSLILGIISVVSPCFAGWYTGNAGDAWSAEFILTGRDLVQRLRFATSDVIELPNADQLAGIIDSVIVHSDETVIIDGHEVDAVNNPEKREIVLNRSRWRNLRRFDETRQRLLVVLHEYMWVMGIEDLGFAKSAPIIDLLGVGDYSPNMYWNPINPVNILELKPQVRVDGCIMPSIEFQTNKDSEVGQSESTGASCTPDTFRRVVVTKTHSVTPASSGVHGTIHSFTINVFDKSNQLLKEFYYEPDWGRCLRPDDYACRYSGGVLTIEGVAFQFGFIRKD
jgi:hypothetical protein